MEKAFQEEYTATWDGLPVYGYWRIPEDSKGLVVIVHGFGEHSARYLQNVIPFFTAHSFAVFGFDLVGHGRSGGKRGHCGGYEQLLGFLHQATLASRQRFPELPLLYYGHGMGGNLIFNYVLRNMGRPQGIIASSPYLRLAFRPPTGKWQVGRILQKIAPGMTLKVGIDVESVARDPKVRSAFQEDPYIHDRISPRFSFPVYEAGEWALQHAEELQVPSLLLHGTANRIIDPEGSRLFHERNPRTRLVLLEGGYHELHNDLDRQSYFEAIQEWLAEEFASDRVISG